ncbi:MAG TPA: PIN domain-containing protein [Trueperaceae bacterium]|nr:PIN domain-containing protein [Trueperaceae bacterium]
MRTAIDTNIISALWSSEPASNDIAKKLFDAKKRGALVIAAPVYAELFAYPNANREFIERFLRDSQIEVDFVLSETVWLKAAESFADYSKRRRKSKAGQAKRLLVDFIIGSHALYEANQLMTLDKNRYLTGFPDLKITA